MVQTTTKTTQSNYPNSDLVSSGQIDPLPGRRRSPLHLSARNDSPQNQQLQKLQQHPVGRNRHRRSSIALPKWQPDEEVSRCPVCDTSFRFFFRKHHCRKCGKVVCYNCSQHRITIPRQFVVRPPALTASSPFNALAGGEVAPTASTSSTQPQNYTSVASGANDPVSSSKRSPSHDLTGSYYPMSGAAEVVRVCNPCVPDPNFSPPPQQAISLPISPPQRFSEDIEHGDSSSRANIQRLQAQPYNSSRSSRDPKSYVYGYFPSSDSRTRRSCTIANSSETASNQGRGTISGSSSKLGPGTTQGAQASATAIAYHRETAPQSQNPTSPDSLSVSSWTDYLEHYPQRVNAQTFSRHRYHHSAESSGYRGYNSVEAAQRGTREFNSVANREASPALAFNASNKKQSLQYLSNASSSASSSASPPHYRSLRSTNQRSRSIRTQVREEDECPVCGQELPPKGPNESEENRVKHVEGCISFYSSSMSSSMPATAPITHPEPQPQLRHSSPADRTTATHGVSPNNDAVTGNSASSSMHTEVTQLAVRPPRATGNRMLVYYATEKDCLAADGELQECVICFEEFAEGDEMGRLECLCKFHRTCIRQWWDRKGNGSCPTHQLHQ